MDTPDLLTTKEAAARLRVSPSMVRKMAASGELPSSRLGTAIRIPSSAVLARLGRVARPEVNESLAVKFAAFDAALADLRVRLHDLQVEAGAVVRSVGGQG